MLNVIKKLILENHAHLCELGVSHPALEAVKSKTAAYDLNTKLTGAGGGGCAVTLVPDSTYYFVSVSCCGPHTDLSAPPSPGYSEERLKQLMTELRADGFEPYLTSVGGSGVGVLSPYSSSDGPSAYDGLATPPETPDASDESVQGLASAPLRAAFENTTSVDFGKWAEGRGRWLYV